MIDHNAVQPSGFLSRQDTKKHLTNRSAQQHTSKGYSDDAAYVELAVCSVPLA